jgi:tetratricopeptide (TPR) repeat protein
VNNLDSILEKYIKDLQHVSKDRRQLVMPDEDIVANDLIAGYNNAKSALDYAASKEFSRKLADHYFRMGDYEASIPYLQEYLGLISNSADIPERVKTNKLIGECYEFSGKLSDAEEYYETALEEANQVNDDLLRAEIKVRLGNLYKEMNLMSLGLGLLEEAIDVYQNKLIMGDGTIHPNHYWSYQVAVNYLANLLTRIGQPQKACQIINEALQFKLKEGTDNLNIARLYSNLGVAYAEFDLAEADTQYSKALEYAQRCNKPHLIAGIYNNLADSLEQRHDYAAALEYYQKAVAILKANSIIRNLVQILNNVATVLWKLGNYDEAIETIKSILQMPSETQNYTQISNTYKTLSDVYKAKGQFKKAMRYLEVYNERNEQRYKKEVIRQAQDVLSRPK